MVSTRDKEVLGDEVRTKVSLSPVSSSRTGRGASFCRRGMLSGVMRFVCVALSKFVPNLCLRSGAYAPMSDAARAPVTMAAA